MNWAIIFISITLSSLTLFPSSEHNASVIHKVVADFFSEQSEHVLDIQVESDILAIKNNKKSIDLFFFFDFFNYLIYMIRVSTHGVSQTWGIYEIDLKSL